MNTKHDEMLDELQEILEKNRDAVKGFNKAAENADTVVLSNYFKRKAAERQEFNKQLAAKIKESYQDFDENGSFSGTIHRAWMDVKALFSAENDEAMLEEAIRGDKAAIEEYDDVLEEDNVPVGLRNLLLAQRTKIMTDISTNRRLEDLKD